MHVLYADIGSHARETGWRFLECDLGDERRPRGFLKVIPNHTHSKETNGCKEIMRERARTRAKAGPSGSFVLICHLHFFVLIDLKYVWRPSLVMHLFFGDSGSE